MKPKNIRWSLQALESVRKVYRYYKDKSPQGALNVRKELLKAPKSILFAGQYQVDDINPKYRRIVVRNYKLLYKEVKGVILIVDVVSTRQSPEELKRK